MTALLIIAAMLIGGLGWVGRRSRQYYYDQDIVVDDVETYCDTNCDNACASDADQDSSS